MTILRVIAVLTAALTTVGVTAAVPRQAILFSQTIGIGRRGGVQ